MPKSKNTHFFYIVIFLVLCNLLVDKLLLKKHITSFVPLVYAQEDPGSDNSGGSSGGNESPSGGNGGDTGSGTQGFDGGQNAQDAAQQQQAYDQATQQSAQTTVDPEAAQATTTTNPDVDLTPTGDFTFDFSNGGGESPMDYAQRAEAALVAATNDLNDNPDDLDAQAAFNAAREEYLAAYDAYAHDQAQFNKEQLNATRTDGDLNTQRDALTSYLNENPNASLPEALNALGFQTLASRPDFIAAAYGATEAAKATNDPIGYGVSVASQLGQNSLPSDRAGVAAIATLAAGGSVENAAKAAAQAAGEKEGLAAFAATMNSSSASSSLNAEQKAHAISEYGNEKGLPYEQISAAMAASGIGEKVALEQLSQVTGKPSSELASAVHNGIQNGVTSGANIIGAPSAVTTTPTLPVAPEAGGDAKAEFHDFASRTISGLGTDASADQKSAAFNSLVENALVNGIPSDVFGAELKDFHGMSSKDMRDAIASVQAAHPEISYSGVGNYGINVMNAMDSARGATLPSGAVVASITPVTTGSATAAAPNPPPAPALVQNQVPAQQTTEDPNSKPLSANPFNSAVNPQDPGPGGSDRIGASFVGVNGTVDVTVSNPERTGTGASFLAGTGGQITIADGTSYTISTENRAAVESLYQTIASHNAPTPAQLSEATDGVAPPSVFGGK